MSLRIARSQRENLPVTRRGSLVPSLSLQREAKVEMRAGIPGLYRNGLFVARHCLVGAAQRLQCQSEIAVQLSDLRFERERLAVTGHRLFGPAKTVEQVAKIAVQFGRGRIEVHSLAITNHRLVQKPLRLQRITLIDEPAFERGLFRHSSIYRHSRHAFIHRLMAQLVFFAATARARIVTTDLLHVH